MHITKQTIIGELVAQEYLTASVFEEHGIDFCCNGNRTIQEACDQQQIESEVLIAHLESLKNQDSGSSVNYNSWPLDLLADYIESKTQCVKFSLVCPDDVTEFIYPVQ